MTTSGSKPQYSARGGWVTTGRVVRHDPAQIMAAPSSGLEPVQPPLPADKPSPCGDLSAAPAEQILAEAMPLWGTSALAAGRVERGLPALLKELELAPGATWQERWQARGLNDGQLTPGDLGSTKPKRGELVTAARILFCLRIVRPSLRAFRAGRYPHYPRHFRLASADPLLDKFFDHVAASPALEFMQRAALVDVTGALTVFGITLRDLTPEGLLHYALEARKLHHGREGRVRSNSGTAAWQLLHSMGHFPANAPHTLRAARTRGQLTVEELVDRHRPSDPGIRDLFVEYLRRRGAGMDYNSVNGIAHILLGTFWRTVEKVNPAQSDLRLTEATYQQWKEAVMVLPGGRRRLSIDAILIKIRSFYLDLQSWAHAEPERWGPWVAPCPVREAEVRWSHVNRRRLNERTADRTRVRQPLLPTLVEHVSVRWLELRELLTATTTAAPGEYFIHSGTRWQRVATQADQRDNGPLRVLNRDTGQLVHVTVDEDGAFLDWAVVEILRHAGLRIEELLELSHLSIRNYQRTNGEVIALLVIAPSKADRERVIPMSAELFHAVAQVIKRHRSQHGTVPLAHSYDPHERIWKIPLPFLFQRRNGLTRSAINPTTVRRRLNERCEALAVTHPEFEGVRFAPHDFRRLFATDLVNSGLPIHIGAALLGHLSIETTRGYVAVFDDDIVRHYQEFLDRRRDQRPTEEYRDPTSTEWSEFEEHFDKRKVELGSCGRPYATPCAHEHACIRCPMLTLKPGMLPRLDEIEEDLLQRRQHANAQGWHGEIEGIDLTLTFLRSKRGQTQRAISLGMPTTIARPINTA